MPYTMTIHPKERRKGLPRVGDTFIVVEIIEDVFDANWGSCDIVRLDREKGKAQPKEKDRQ